MTDPFPGLQGWLTAAEGAALQEIAADRRVLEVGCWKARSTIYLASVARQVVTVDHFRGDRYTGPANTLPEALANLDAHGVRDRVVLMAGRFEHVLPLLDLAAFDVIFYDADHTYDATAAALALFADSRAAVAVHDYEPTSTVYAGAYRAVSEFRGRTGRSLRVVDRLAILRMDE